MSTERLKIDEQHALVEWHIEGLRRGAEVVTPWGRIWLGEEMGGGRMVMVAANHDFFLIVHTAEASYSEHVTPGKHRLLLTVLDRTDMRDETDSPT